MILFLTTNMAAETSRANQQSIFTCIKLYLNSKSFSNVQRHIKIYHLKYIICALYLLFYTIAERETDDCITRLICI